MLEIARRVVTEIAPDEAPLFEPLAQAYLDNPTEFTAEHGGRDDMLGFGGLEAVPMFTPIVVAQVSHLLLLAQDALQAAGPQAASLATFQPSAAAGDMVFKSFEHAGTMVGGSLILSFLNHLLTAGTRGIERVGPLTSEQVAEIRGFLIDHSDPKRIEGQAEAFANALLHAVGIHWEGEA